MNGSTIAVSSIAVAASVLYTIAIAAVCSSSNSSSSSTASDPLVMQDK